MTISGSDLPGLQLLQGYYVFESLNQADGSVRGRFGPYSYAFMRDFLQGLTTHLDKRTVHHALTVTQDNPGTPFDLTDVRERHGVAYIHWSARLTWFRSEGVG